MYSNEIIDSYLYGDNSGNPDSAQRGQAMAMANIMESAQAIAQRLAEIAGFLEDRLGNKEPIL